jgi:hypothetical protein
MKPRRPIARACLAAAWLALAALAGGAPEPAAAETLRCNGQSASEGDSRLAVLHKCGRPTLQDSYCAPLFYADTLNAVPDPIASAVLPCQPVEVWLYDRGPGQLMASVRFRAGVVASIVYGTQPR